MAKGIIKSGQARFIQLPLQAGAEPEEPQVDPKLAAKAAARELEVERAKLQVEYTALLSNARKEASRLLDDARRAAKNSELAAREKAASIKETAREDGYEAGRAEGHAAGMEEAGNEIREIIAKGQADVDAALAEAYGTRDRIVAETESKVYGLALDIAEKILSYELDHNEEAYMTILSQAVGSIQAETKVTLRVNASEYMRYFHSRDQARIRTENGPVTAGVVIDASVEPGGCLLETETGMIDASVNAQLEQIAHNLGIER